MKSSLLVMLLSIFPRAPPLFDRFSTPVRACSPLALKLYFTQPVCHFMKFISQVNKIDAPWSICTKLTGLRFLWLLFRILKTFLMRTGLIYVGSISISSSLKVIEFISSLAIVQLGATHPLRMQTILRTFSTKWLGLTCFLKLIMCCLVSCLIDISVILTA